LSIVADQLNQQIVVPELVVVEATAHYRRELHAVRERFQVASTDLAEAFNLEYVHSEPQPDPDGREQVWRQRLLDMCEMLPTDPSDAVKALEREVHGIAPARERREGKPGVGARDAAIWLAVLRDHLQRNETGHFITKNTKDFFHDDRLKPHLVEDLDGATHPLHVHPGIAALLAAMGTSTADTSIDPVTVTKRGYAAVAHGLANSSVVPRALFDSTLELRFRTVVTSGKALKVHKAQRFARKDDSVIIVDAEWNLVADCLYQDLARDESDGWGVIHDVALSGRLQIYLPEIDDASGKAQLIAAQLASTMAVSPTEDGRLLILEDPFQAEGQNQYQAMGLE